ELRNITKDFPGVRALDGVSFTLEQGEIHALCGENGAGKSTLIKTLCGINPAGTYGGEILLDGAPVKFHRLRDAEEHGIALIAQELALVPELSVEENLALGREPVRAGLIRWDVVREQARVATQLVGLDIDPSRAIKELGIGQQQLVEIGKALAKKARILVLDEPTAALTEADTARLMSLLRGLKASGVSCIYISHRLEEVFQIADRVTVLRDGRSVGGGLCADLTAEKVIAMMVGREVGTLYPRPPHHPGVPLLKVANWTVEDPLVPGRNVLRNVSLEVREREILGIGGLMGAGRTALVSSLFGAARSRVTGTLSLGGAAPRAPFRSPPEAIAAGLALVSEDRKRYGLVIEHSVSENLTLASLRRYSKGPLVDDEARGEKAREEAGALNIRASALGSAVRQLSGGNQQKVVLGKWLLTRPRVLFLDEPTRGVDVGAKAEIHRLIAELAESGLGVVLVSSDLPELLGMSHRVLVLSLGAATAELSASEATPEAVMTAATVKV
ncbi:MAG TPA: ATP-binding cassette domain-containing protein, partial [Vicinamibacteria bacterium]|nr:ATP-binding cassette domain-containing protein [Vicinamibacteria bacterium]